MSVTNKDVRKTGFGVKTRPFKLDNLQKLFYLRKGN